VCALALRAFDALRLLRSPLNRYNRHAARYDHPLAGANLAIGVRTAIGQPCEPRATGVGHMFHFLVVGVACLDRFLGRGRPGQIPAKLGLMSRRRISILTVA
jgi:hypothetical protein